MSSEIKVLNSAKRVLLKVSAHENEIKKYSEKNYDQMLEPLRVEYASLIDLYFAALPLGEHYKKTDCVLYRAQFMSDAQAKEHWTWTAYSVGKVLDKICPQ